MDASADSLAPSCRKKNPHFVMRFLSNPVFLPVIAAAGEDWKQSRLRLTNWLRGPLR